MTMGPCCSCSGNDEIAMLSEENRWTFENGNFQSLRKHVKQCYNIYKTVTRLNSHERLERLWEHCMAQCNPSSNIFSGISLKHPEVLYMFEVNTVHWSKVANKKVMLSGESIGKFLHMFEFGLSMVECSNSPKNVKYAAHLLMVQNMIGKCLLTFICQGDYFEMILALYNLGAFHCQKGVTIAQMITFEATGMSVLAEHLNKDSKRPVNQDGEIIHNVFQIVCQVILAGMRRQSDTMLYVRLTLDKQGHWWNRRLALKKCRPKLAKQSWRKMDLYLSKL